MGRDRQINNAAAEIETYFAVAACSPSDCDSCSSNEKYPPSLSIDTETPLWRTAKPWQTHILCATGKSDWVHSVIDEEDTLAHAINITQKEWNKTGGISSGVMISNSSLPPPDDYFEHHGPELSRPTRALLLPEFLYVDGITPESAQPDLSAIMSVINKERQILDNKQELNEKQNGNSSSSSDEEYNDDYPTLPQSVLPKIQLPLASASRILPANEAAFILICSHRTRDKRCAVTANILKKKFDFELRDLDLYRDPSDDRPGGARVVCISHVGGHRFAANVLVYTKSGQGIWLARVRPDHVKLIVRHCVLKGEVFPELLRGAFNSNPISW